MSPQLAPAGSSTYSSNTLKVGDGTWDAGRETFLLPNLVGLNFETMRYNGMGNRFAGLDQYHSLIRGHGIVAAITFLLVVPAAILTARFYRRRPLWALRFHIMLQIITVFLTTVVFVLGWFAVGPNRSLTNPHHAIGLAIYVLVLFQALAGWFVHAREKGKMRSRIPLKLMFHQWLGRGIALLGIAQVPLGLTLYGSPRTLFALYAIWVSVLFLLYFILSYRHGAPVALGRRGSVVSSSYVEEGESHHRHGRLGALAGIGAAGAGLAAMKHHRRRSRSRSGTRVDDVIGSRPPTESYIDNEKYTRRDHERRGWMDTLLKVGALGGAVALARNFMHGRSDRERNRRRRDDSPSRDSISQESMSMMEGGESPSRHHRPHPAHRRNDSLTSISSHTSDDSRRYGGHHPVRDGVATVGALGLLRAAFKGRRDKKERRRVDELRRQEIEEERVARQGAHRQRYTGDGFPRRGGRRGSITSTDYTSVTPSVVNPRPHHHGIPPPLPTANLQQSEVIAGRVMAAPVVNPTSTAPNPVVPPIPMPAAPPDPQGILHESSGSDVFVATDGRNHHRHRSATDAAALGAAAGIAAGIATNRTSSSQQQSGDSVATPPISVKVKMHGDGRHVTLRRLSEQEAAAERDVRRREQNNMASGNRRHRRRDSGSDLSGLEQGDRWRRVEAMERRQAEEMQREQQAAAAAAAANTTAPPPPPAGISAPPPGISAPPHPPPPQYQQQAFPPPPAAFPQNVGLVPPPPIPAAVGGPPGSVGSPGTVTTDASGDYASRRNRRRAERNANRRPAGTVDFD